MAVYLGTFGPDSIDQTLLGLSDWSDIQGLAGDDTITGGAVRIDGGQGDDKIVATSPWTTVVYWSSVSGVLIDLDAGYALDGWGTRDTLVDVHVVQGSGYADVVLGSPSHDEFWAGPGDVFDGKSGNDTAVVWTPMAEWSVAANENGSFTLHRIADAATVLLADVETVRFSDGVRYLTQGYSVDRVFTSAMALFPADAFLLIDGFDLNDDGLMDVVVTAGVFPPVAPAESMPVIFLQEIDGGFVQASITGSPEGFVHPREIAVGDFNADGRTDLVIVGHGYDTSPFPGERSTVLLASDDGYQDVSEWLPQQDGFTHSVAVADVNRDGFDDIYLGNIYGQQKMPPKLLLSNEGAGFIEADLPVVVGAGALQGGVLPIASLLVDLDRDGYLDLVVGSGPEGNWIFPGRSTGPDATSGFFASTGVPLPAGLFGAIGTVTVDIVACDLNDDGRLDLLLSQTDDDPFYQGRGLQILIQQQDGRFVDETGSRLPSFDATEAWITFVKTVDLDGDADPDLFATGTDGASTLAWINDGSGVFAPAGAGNGFPKLDGGNLLAQEPGTLFSVSLVDQGKVAIDRLTLSHDAFAVRGTITGTSNDDSLIGTSASDAIVGGAGDDAIHGGAGDDTIDGGSGDDTARYDGEVAGFSFHRIGATYTLQDMIGSEGTDSVTSVEQLRFADMTVNLTVQTVAAAAPQADVQRLIELYVAFFNRVPDADGLEYWIGRKVDGLTVNQIAESFYDAGVAYPALTGFSATMSHEDFVKVVYLNVLGRDDETDPTYVEGVAYWAGELANGNRSRGELVSIILDSAHTFKGDATYGYVADLLDNKIEVAQTFAVNWGLNYNTPQESIANGMAIAAAITPTDTSAAIALIGIDPGRLDLVA